jgi:hypothetical protein
MAEAKKPGGLYYIGETAVDANGVAVEGAPKRGKDTPPEKQPGAIGNPSSDPIARLADLLAGKKQQKAETDEDENEDESKSAHSKSKK